MVDFYKDWYDNLIAHSNEKHLLVEKISDLLKGKAHQNCLEIGLGTSAYFSERLSDFFNEYWIVERQQFSHPLPQKVTLIQGDFETIELTKNFDVIIASHVVYYFNELSKTIRKIVNSLKEGGRAYFVVNGKESDYSPIKNAFSTFINKPYTFTYDILKSELKDYEIREYTTQASISFKSYEDLYETLRLSFDLYPEEYQKNKQKMIEWLKKNIKGDKFFIDQKIIEVYVNYRQNVWDELLKHKPYYLKFEDIDILIEDGVFTPNPEITYSTSMILENLPKLNNTRVADIGTGTGIIAIKAAKEGAEVIATDISDKAIDNTLVNLKNNKLADKVRVIKTNLLEGVKEKFDFIFANIPILDEVWETKNIKVDLILRNLLKSTKGKLKKNGKIYLPWASFAEEKRKKLEDYILEEGYEFKLREKERLGYIWYLYIISKK